MAGRGATPMLIVTVIVSLLLYFLLVDFCSCARAKNFFSIMSLYIVLQLEILYTFAPCHGANVKIGVPENYDGIFPWYLAKVRLSDVLEMFTPMLFLCSVAYLIIKHV